MKSYEGIFIFPPETTPEVRKQQIKGLEELAQKFGGVLGQMNEWGKRPLGYSVKKFREGYFVIADFQMEPGQAAPFRQALLLQEDVIKFFITAKNLKAEKRTQSKRRSPGGKPPQHVGSSPSQDV